MINGSLEGFDNMKRNILSTLLGAWLTMVGAAAHAEDIDLFVDNPASATEAPNVLLVLDNGANFSASATFPSCPGVTGMEAMANTTGGIEQCALYKVVEGIEAGKVKLGVMVFNANGMFANCPGDDGGCLVYPITAMTETNKTAMLAWIKSWKTSGSTDATTLNIKSNNNKNGAVMQEAWALYAGRMGLSGRDYTELKPEGSCGKNYVIFVGNSYNNSGNPGEGGNVSPKAALEGILSGSSAAMNAFPAATTVQKTTLTGPVPVSCEGGGSFTFSGSNQENKGWYADEWVRYMHSQNIVTYSIGLLSNACKKEYEALMKSMGDEKNGGGKYFPTTDFSTLVTAFNTALSEIQSVNSVFASVSLPVSVNTQGTYLNQVFVGMFRPDGGGNPRWHGNLKQYKLGFLDGSLKLLDADGASAISSGESGFLAECGRSFWTPAKADAASHLYWTSLTEANCPPAFPAAAETPDGNMVEKGGQGYKLRALTPSSRKVLTCGSTCTTTLADFNSSNAGITKAALGNAAMTDAERVTLIDWARGLNSDGEQIGTLTTADAMLKMRPSSHGDVVHSRPVAVNFAATDDDPPKVVVFYGANDGMLRAVNGNRDGVVGDPGVVGGKNPGEELWSFVPPESYGLFKRLKANAPIVKFSNVTAATATPKDYGFDGPITAYKGASSAWVFATMRRGGRMLYAFDVPSASPQNPSLKWRIGCPNQDNDTGCTAGLEGIGQTWGVPEVVKAAGHLTGSTPKPLLLMGGGYDRCEDADPATCTTDSKGHAVYVLDAETGTRLNTLATDGSVIGDIATVKDSTGLLQFAYAADTRGNVYRISGAENALIGSVAPASWIITKIASLGGTGTSARKFMFGPDVVADASGYYLLLGSGDREKPVSDYPNAALVQNYFFALRDQPLNSSWLSDEATTNCAGASVLCLNSLLPITDATPTSTSLAAKKGWYLQLEPTEQVVTSALTFFGQVNFSTHQPDTGLLTGSCSAKLGETRVYSVSFRNAEGNDGQRFTDVVGDGLPPSAVGGLVTLDDGTTVPFCIGCSDRPLEGSEPPLPPSAVQPKARVFWNIEQ